MIYIYVILFLLTAFLYWKFRRNISIPRGLKRIPIEEGLPLIGIIHKLESPILEFYEKLTKKHGSIFGIKMGMRDVFILNDYQTIKKTFLENGNNFSGRWKLQQALFGASNAGIVSVDGDIWSIQRTFILKVFHDFGIGKSRSVEIIQNECSYLLEEIEKLNGKCVNLEHLLPIYSANIISKFIMNKRFSKGDSKMTIISDLVVEFGKKKDIYQIIFFTLPIFDKLVWLCNLIMTFTSRGKQFETVHKIFQEEIDEHRKILDLNSEGEDLIDRYLVKQHQMKEKNGSIQSFTDFQLIRNALELFVAGYETTTSTLEWSLLFMSKHPEIQNKVYNEIVDNIGKERIVTMNDKKILNYTQAVMDEIFRISSVLPLAIIHRTINDSSVNGYFIPKNSLVLSNLFACHFDPNIWEKPKEFYPDHFLSTDSNGVVKYTSKEELNPFGVGKRQCLGESLARMEYFIFFTSIMQRFQVKFAENVTERQYEEANRSNEGLLRVCLIKDFIFIKRE